MMTQEYTVRPIEAPNVQRGTLMALIAVPVGVVAYSALYQLGFVASVVAFGVAWLASRLYRIGSGAPLNRQGAIRVAVITIGTVVLSIVAAIIWSGAVSYAEVTDATAIAALSDPLFWTVFGSVITEPEALQQLAPDVLLGLAFGALGCFGILRNAFRSTSPAQVYLPTPEERAAFEAPVERPTERGPYGAMADEDRDPKA